VSAHCRKVPETWLQMPAKERSYQLDSLSVGDRGRGYMHAREGKHPAHFCCMAETCFLSCVCEVFCELLYLSWLFKWGPSEANETQETEEMVSAVA
jgi:hypothetical protein